MIFLSFLIINNIVIDSISEKKTELFKFYIKNIKPDKYK